MADIYTAHRETRDNLGNPEEDRRLRLVGPFYRTVVMELGPIGMTRQDVGNSFVVGLPSNARLGTQRLGKIDYVEYGLQRVVNWLDTFRERFRFDTFIDTDTSTGTLDTTNFWYRLDQDQIYQSKTAFKNEQTVTAVTLNVVITSGGEAEIIIDTSQSGQETTL